MARDNFHGFVMDKQENIDINGDTHLDLRGPKINCVANNNGVVESRRISENVHEIVTAEVPRRVIITESKTIRFWRLLGPVIGFLVIGWIVATILIFALRSTNSPTVKDIYNFSDSSLSSHISSPRPPTTGQCDTIACKESVQELLSSLNTSVNPCDNFYEFACQGWQNHNPRPRYETSWNVFAKLSSASEDTLQNILEQPKNESPSLAQAKRFYKSCIDFDTKSNKKYALNVMLKTLEKYGGWPLMYKPGTWKESKFDWMRSVVDLKRLFGQSVLLGIDFLTDVGKSEYRILLHRPNTTPASLFRLTGAESKAFSVLTVYKDRIMNISRELISAKGDILFTKSYLEEKALEILYVQSEIERLGNIPVLSYLKDSRGLNDSIVEIPLNKLQYQLDKYLRFQQNELNLQKLLDMFFAGASIKISKTEPIKVADVAYIFELSEFLSSIKPEALANYLLFEIALNMASIATGKLKGFVDNLEQSLYGTTGRKPRSKVCIGMVKEKFPDILGQAYVKSRYPNPSTSQFEFAVARKMFRNIKLSLADLLSASANKHLNMVGLQRVNNGVGLCVGHPVWIYDDEKVDAQYKGLGLTQRTFLEQYMAVSGWAVDKDLKTFRNPVKNDECSWERFSGNAEAYNVVVLHMVYLPVGIMQGPFFSLDYPEVLRYGRLGMILGHEITHSLNKHGWRKFDNGTRTRAAECFVQQYNNFTASNLKEENVSLNGTLTLDENIPDNVGLITAYKAYKKAKLQDSKPARKPDGLKAYTDDQLFFIAFAQNFCASTTPEYLEALMKGSDHSPLMFRVLGALRNSKEFAQAWSCPVGSNMNPPVERKCSMF